MQWVVDQGRRVEIEWPRGYTAQFTPELVVLNESGEVVAVEGDRASGICLGGGPDGEPWLPTFAEQEESSGHRREARSSAPA
jgi:hypothetical protein